MYSFEQIEVSNDKILRHETQTRDPLLNRQFFFTRTPVKFILNAHRPRCTCEFTIILEGETVIKGNKHGTRTMMDRFPDFPSHSRIFHASTVQAAAHFPITNIGCKQKGSYDR